MMDSIPLASGEPIDIATKSYPGGTDGEYDQQKLEERSQKCQYLACSKRCGSRSHLKQAALFRALSTTLQL